MPYKPRVIPTYESLKSNEVVIVAQTLKLRGQLDFKWGYCWVTKDKMSEFVPTEAVDFWMEKLTAIDEVSRKFDRPMVYYIRGVRYPMSVYCAVNYKRRPELDELCLKIRKRLVESGSVLYPVMRGSKQWYISNKATTEIFDYLNPNGWELVKEIDNEFETTK